MASPPPSERETFRADIEGLRAVAVLLVIAFHARIPFFTGGYVGVDVFYVVSGYLITGLIVRELGATGRVDLPAFYARRARRLLPAALVVIAATVLVSAIVLPPLQFVDVARDGAASALYVGNIRFAAQATDYLQAELAPSPLLHFWSLGVEEQFYLVWPALLWLVAGRVTDFRRIGVAIAAVAIVSLGVGIAWTATDAPLAFFLLPARAWELAVGAGLALAAPRLARMPATVGLGAVAGGLLLIGAGAVTFGLETPFPGTAALVPVAGAALVVSGGLRQPLNAASGLLATRPMRRIGGISYSLYLWHWPVLVLPAAAFGAALPWPARLGLVALTFVLAEGSRRWIEDPIRHGSAARVRPSRTLAAFGAMSLVVAGASLGVGRLTAPPVVASTGAVELDLPSTVPAASVPASTAAPSRSPAGEMTPAPTAKPTLAPTPGGPVPDDLVPSLGAVRDDIPAIYDDACHAEWLETRPKACVYGEADAETTVVLIGDSHAAHWFPTLERLAKERGWRLISLTKSACPVADLPVYNSGLKRAYAECEDWRDAVLGRIVRERPAMVVVSGSRTGSFWVDGAAVDADEHEDLWGPALERSIRAIDRAAGEVVVIGDTPRPRGDAPVCLSDHPDDVLACATPPRRALGPERTATERAVSAATGATFIDPTPWLCPTTPCPAVIGRVLVYRDGHHMTTAFARALAPYLEPLLPALPDR